MKQPGHLQSQPKKKEIKNVKNLFLHYHCAALLDQIKSSKDYFPPHRVFTLVVLTSGDKHQKDIGIDIINKLSLE